LPTVSASVDGANTKLTVSFLDACQSKTKQLFSYIGIVAMKGPKAKIAPRRRGRPRSEKARQEILKTAYKLLRDNGFNSVGSHEIAEAAAVSSATLYRWWKSKEEILFDACFEHIKPILAIRGTGSALTRLRRYVLRACEFLVSEEGTVMARVVTGIHEDKRLSQMFLERYVRPRRQIQRKIIEDAIASGELKSTTDPELLIDALNGPLFFRWLQGHAALDKAFAKNIFDNVIRAFQPR
jgi:AcrR family transcriptional regulator